MKGKCLRSEPKQHFQANIIALGEFICEQRQNWRRSAIWFFGWLAWVFGGVALLHEHDAVEWIRSHLVMGTVSPIQQVHTSVSRMVEWVLLGAWQCDAAPLRYVAVAPWRCSTIFDMMEAMLKAKRMTSNNEFVW